MINFTRFPLNSLRVFDAAQWILEDALTAVVAAERGDGLALARWRLVSNSVANRTLAIAGQALPYRFNYYWVTRRGHQLSVTERRFLHWLKQASESSARPHIVALRR
jgi:DNA-binding transcriptional LysR family regulator